MGNLVELRNPYGVVNGKLLHVKDIDKGLNISCPICKDTLIVREGSRRKHLSHKLNKDNHCSNESFIHRLTKQYLYNELKFLKIKEHKIEIIDNKFKLSKPEKLYIKSSHLESRELSNKYIPDIFIVLEGNYKVALEICYKSPKDINHLHKLLPELPIDMVLEIKVTENDLLEFDIDKLLDKSNIIYNRIGIGFINSERKVLDIVHKYNVLISKEKELKQLIEYKSDKISKLEDTNGYSKEVHKHRKNIRAIHSIFFKEKYLSLASEAYLCEDAILEIKEKYDNLNKKNNLFTDAILNIHDSINGNKNYLSDKLNISTLKCSDNLYKLESTIDTLVRNIRNNSTQKKLIRKHEDEKEKLLYKISKLEEKVFTLEDDFNSSSKLRAQLSLSEREIQRLKEIVNILNKKE